MVPHEGREKTRRDLILYKEHKIKRALMKDIQRRELRQEKYVDPEALKRFREVPYQLKCARRLRDEGKNDGKLEKT